VSYAAFQSQIARPNDMVCTMNLMAWDSRTVMPPGGVEARGRQTATLTDLARVLATSDARRRALDGAREGLKAAPKDDIRRRALAQAEAEIATL
jgi:carboxypeptidase Taq